MIDTEFLALLNRARQGDGEDHISVNEQLIQNEASIGQCLAVFAQPAGSCEEWVLTLCSGILEPAFRVVCNRSRECDQDDIVGKVREIAERCMRIMMDLRSNGRIQCRNIARFLDLVTIFSPVEYGEFMKYGFQAMETTDSAQFGFVVLNVVSNMIRRNRPFNEASAAVFVEGWGRVVTHFVTPEHVFSIKGATIVSELMAQYSYNVKFWKEQGLFLAENGMVAADGVIQIFRQVAAIAGSGSVITSEEIRQACLMVVRRIVSVSTYFDDSVPYGPWFNGMYMCFMEAVLPAVRVFTGDMHYEIANCLLMFVKGHFARANECGIFRDMSVVARLCEVIWRSAELSPIVLEYLDEDRALFYQEAFMNEVESLRNTACSFVSSMCGVLSVSKVIDLFMNFPATEGLVRIASVCCEAASRCVGDAALIPQIARLISHATATQVIEDPRLGSMCRLCLMADSLFAGGEDHVKNLCTTLFSETHNFLQKGVELEKGVFDELTFTIGCKLLKAAVCRGVIVPGELIGYLIERASFCASGDVITIVGIISVSIENCVNCGAVVQFLLSEILRIEELADGSMEEEFPYDTERKMTCFKVISEMYRCKGGDKGVDVRLICCFWQSFMSLECPDERTVRAAVDLMITLCSNNVSGVHELIRPLWYTFTLDDDFGDRIMRWFVAFFHSDVRSQWPPEERVLFIAEFFRYFRDSYATIFSEYELCMTCKCISLFVQEKWLPAEQLVEVLGVARSLTEGADPIQKPTQCLAALELIMSVYLFGHAFDPLLLWPSLMEHCAALLATHSVVTRESAVLHALFFLKLGAERRDQAVSAVAGTYLAWEPVDESVQNDGLDRTYLRDTSCLVSSAVQQLFQSVGPAPVI